MENNLPNTPAVPTVGEDEIDLIELAQKLWKERKFILKACAIGAVVGLIVAFSIPKEYKTEVKLAPENTSTSKVGQLGGLAAMAGINLGSSASGTDALYPDLYPDIVKSTPFLLELIDIPVETKKGDLKTTFYDYIQEHQKATWWSYITGVPFKALGWGMSLFRDKEEESTGKLNPFNLTKDQEEFILTTSEKIMVSVDKKTGVISASVMMQDPLVSATIMDIVLTKLQTYITDYRTRKAKHDLAFSEKLFNEAKDNYYKAQKAYARYVDENRNVISASSRTEEERLRNEMSLAYGVYNQMAQQLEMNKVKVQEQTPVYTVIEPARVAIRAAKPSKILVLVGFVFLAWVVSVGWVLVKETLLNLYKTTE